MKIKVTRTGDLLKRLEERARSPQQLLKQFGGYLRAGAKDKIASGEGMAPWAESTRRKYEQAGTGAVTAHGGVRTSYARNLDKFLRRKGSSEAREELRKLFRGGRADDSQSRPIQRLQRRLDRAKKDREAGKRVNIGKRRIERHTLLGKLYATFASRLEGKTRVIVENFTGFSAAQNDGAVVGNGASIPSRKFLEITADASRWMAERTLDFLLRD